MQMGQWSIRGFELLKIPIWNSSGIKKYFGHNNMALFSVKVTKVSMQRRNTFFGGPIESPMKLHLRSIASPDKFQSQGSNKNRKCFYLSN